MRIYLRAGKASISFDRGQARQAADGLFCLLANIFTIAADQRYIRIRAMNLDRTTRPQQHVHKSEINPAWHRDKKTWRIPSTCRHGAAPALPLPAPSCSLPLPLAASVNLSPRALLSLPQIKLICRPQALAKAQSALRRPSRPPLTPSAIGTLLSAAVRAMWRIGSRGCRRQLEGSIA